MPLDASEKMERLLYIGVRTLVVAVLLPFIPVRHHWILADREEYLAALPLSVLFALLIGASAVYEYIRKPAQNHRLGYRLVGQFRVRGKQQVFGTAWLELEPDDLHRVPIEAAVYDRFQKGDLVSVVYSATEDLISVRKISAPAPTP